MLRLTGINAQWPVEVADTSLRSPTSCSTLNGQCGSSNRELPRMMLPAPLADRSHLKQCNANTNKAATTCQLMLPPLGAKMPATKLMHQAASTAMTNKILPSTCVPTTPRCHDVRIAASKFASAASTTASFAVANTSLTDQASPEFVSGNARRQNNTLMTHTRLS